ncbi:MAG: hypothetical protein HY774_06045 [Acidobacteria bacterium]|nr:hypothetical protein [Acidobacteriota bacterium]
MKKRESQFPDGVQPVANADLAREIEGLGWSWHAAQYPSVLQPGGQGGI